jgi:hypothetical protein
MFLRLWHEVSSNSSIYETNTFVLDKKWYPLNKGGIYRKWYGNNEYVIDWLNNGEAIKAFSGSVIRNPSYYLKESLTWTMLSASCFGIRYSKQGKIFEGAGPSLFIEKTYIYYVLGLLCSKLGDMIIRALNPTINININDVLNLPLVYNKEKSINVDSLVQQNIGVSKADWDAHETSWDFEANPLVSLRNETVVKGNLDSSFKVSAFVEQFETIWEERFNQLHENEEELNRQFIDIYGLQDELSPEVPKNEITILQQGEINLVQVPGSDNDFTLQWNEDVLMKQLISYAVGVWMGRYKLGQKGLHIAHPNPTDKELQEYWYGGVQVYIDDDGLIPVLPQSSPFDDNLSSRISDFVRITFGEDKLTENLNYIEQKLGTSIDQYVQKDFWKDHKKMYQNRPIYWLFSSSKGAFKCLAYMHRMNAYTAERVRSNYLLPYIEFLQNQIGEMENRRATLSTTENRKLQNFQKALEECREYHERLQVVAEQAIAFDLDDGVVVNYAKFGDVLAKIK